MADKETRVLSLRSVNERAEMRERDMAALAAAKETERRMLRRKKGLRRIPVTNGYVLTNRPEAYVGYTGEETELQTTTKQH